MLGSAASAASQPRAALLIEAGHLSCDGTYVSSASTAAMTTTSLNGFEACVARTPLSNDGFIKRTHHDHRYAVAGSALRAASIARLCMIGIM